MKHIELTPEQLEAARVIITHQRVSKAGRARWSGMSKEEKKAHINRMVEARKAKKLAHQNEVIDKQS